MESYARVLSPNATEIREFLDKNRTQYTTLLSDIKGLLKDMELAGVRHVYSRGEKQNGNEFKDVFKIVRRVDKERKTNSGFILSEVWDIIGITVIFNYHSDLENALGAFREAASVAKFSIIHDEYRSNQGYYAHHVVVQSKKPNSFGKRCEVQLKTLLHEAWANKTHDLSYKPSGELDPRIRQQMQLIGMMLQSVEQQSEILRSLVEEQWTEDSELRIAAQRALLFDVMHRSKTDRDDVKSLATHLQEAERRLAHASVDDETLAQTVEKIDRLSEAGRHGDASVFATYLACLRPTPDLRLVAEHVIGRWVEAAASGGDPNTRDWREARIFQAYAAYVLGDVRTAIEFSQKSLSLLEQAEASSSCAMKANLAYYLAESQAASQEEWHENKFRAEALMDEVKALMDEGKDTPPLPDAAILNTQGFIKIAFGTTEVDIREGLELCRHAASLAGTGPQRQIADHFFALHERQAWRRILKL